MKETQINREKENTVLNSNLCTLATIPKSCIHTGNFHHLECAARGQCQWTNTQIPLVTDRSKSLTDLILASFLLFTILDHLR